MIGNERVENKGSPSLAGVFLKIQRCFNFCLKTKFKLKRKIPELDS